MAADFQMSHPNTCSQASTGTFGSKFVTVCVSGNESNYPGTEGYQVGKREIEGKESLLSCTTVLFIFSLFLSQVSNQCVSLVRDDCFIPTVDAPELGYIRESTNEQYVPDVFYKVTVLIYSLMYSLSSFFTLS